VKRQFKALRILRCSFADSSEEIFEHEKCSLSNRLDFFVTFFVKKKSKYEISYVYLKEEKSKQMSSGSCKIQTSAPDVLIPGSIDLAMSCLGKVLTEKKAAILEK
jgi:hypothetical protein